MSPGDLRRAHQADLQLLSVVYFCRDDVAQKRAALALAEARLFDAEDAYAKSRAVVDAEAVPFAIELRKVG